MYSMFEKIRELPLFKGISHNCVMEFAEKIQLSFSKYKKDDIIVHAETMCNSVKCLLNGNIRNKTYILDNSLEMSYSLGSGTIIGAHHLFGLETKYGTDIYALDNCSIMEFSKKQYLHFLQKNELMLINYLNYLSHSNHYNFQSLRHNPMNSGILRILYIIDVTTPKKSFDISIKSSKESLSSIFGFMSEDEYNQIMDKLLTQRKIYKYSDNYLKIISKDLLLNN